MAMGILGLMALGLAGSGGGSYVANKLSKHIGGQDEFLYNPDDNITGADANVNKQSNTNLLSNRQGLQTDGGELDSDGNAPGTSSLIEKDINGDPDGASPLDVATKSQFGNSGNLIDDGYGLGFGYGNKFKPFQFNRERRAKALKRHWGIKGNPAKNPGLFGKEDGFLSDRVKRNGPEERNDAAIVQGAKDSVDPYTDPVSGMKFNNHKAYLDYVDKYPVMYRWKSNRPMRRIFKGETSPQEQYDIKEKRDFTTTQFQEKQAIDKTNKEKEEAAKKAALKAERWEKVGQSLMDLGAGQMNTFQYKNIYDYE